MTPSSRDVGFTRVPFDGQSAPVSRAVPVEAAIAVEFNGLAYAVMMATPADLDDFAYGFALGEGLIDRAEQILGVEHGAVSGGSVVRVRLAAELAETTLGRFRHRAADSSCGLCGVESLEQALRPPPRLTTTNCANNAAIFRALNGLRGRQPLNAMTGAVHAAARCAADGTILDVREDVGRHNAFDKLIGAMLRAGHGWDGGFALLTSRASFELVDKAARAACPLLATISAPTSLALDRARESGVQLVVLARSDAFLKAQ